MRHNKVLGLAIASALALGENSSFAGTLNIQYVSHKDTAGNCNAPASGPAVIASEVFFSGDKTVFSPFTCGTPDNLDNSQTDGPAATPTSYDDGYLYATYNFDTSTLDTTPFLAQFSLDNGAQFGNNISLASGSGLDFVGHPSGSHAGVTKNSGGAAGDGQVSFYIIPTSGNGFKRAQDTLFLRFSLKNLSALKDPGQAVKMTARVYTSPTDTTGTFDGTPASSTVLTSTRATKVSLDSYAGTVQIDVAQGGKNFVGSGSAFVNSTTVKLGSAAISNNSSLGTVLKEDGAPWTFGGATGTLTVVNLPLSASSASPGAIFLDFDNDGVYESTNSPQPDILATLDPTQPNTATWTLNATQLGKFYSATGSTKVDIVLQADGATVIQEQAEVPQAVLQINYGGGITEAYKRNLIQIKRNGTVCSIYNVPNPNAMDEGNIRVTNTSGKDTQISGSLRDKQGMYVFRNQVLKDKVAANETLYIPSADLCDSTKYPKTSEWTTAKGDVCFDGRGVLTVTSDSNSLEIYGLVRNKAGGPLTNMSVGATGNGCD
jgi:hypothetical protein